MEATAASSPKDFRNKIFICKKEAQETKYWLRMLSEYFNDRKPELRLLWKEAHELTLIFQSITNKLYQQTTPIRAKTVIKKIVT